MHRASDEHHIERPGGSGGRLIGLERLANQPGLVGRDPDRAEVAKVSGVGRVVDRPDVKLCHPLLPQTGDEFPIHHVSLTPQAHAVGPASPDGRGDPIGCGLPLAVVLFLQATEPVGLNGG